VFAVLSLTGIHRQHAEFLMRFSFIYDKHCLAWKMLYVRINPCIEEVPEGT